MFGRTRAGLLSVAILPLGIGLAVQSPEADRRAPQAGPVSYSRQVAPIFRAKCSECHGTDTQEAGLDLSTYESAMKGSEYGTVIEAGDADGSLLIEMVSAGEMPQDADPLPADEVALIRSWIEAGATNN
ncbi:MAG: c-type cytochrome domain-containing protein [Gemmatimonadales bacterium]